jgi:rubrerythrin
MKKRTTSRQSSNSRSSSPKPTRTRSRSTARRVNLNQEWLRNFLWEMLAVERGGVQLYEKALEELSHEDLRSKLDQFHEQTLRHVELCEEMLDAAGGAEGVGPGAEAAEHKAEGLLTASVPEEMADINNIENLVLAETKDHWNWEMLASVIGEIEDRELKKIAGRAVREVRRQENDHLTWSQKMLTRIVTETAHKEPEMEQESEEESEDAPRDYR